MDKILLPVEDRFFADEQVNFLAKHKLNPDSKISVLSVSGPFIPNDFGFTFPSPYWEQMITEDQNYRKTLISDVVKKLRTLFPAIAIDEHMLNGSPATEINRFAREGKFDWIVMGSHGRSGLDKLLLGSVAQSVSSHAPCSVSIIRCTGKGAEPKSDSESKNEVDSGKQLIHPH